MSDDLALTWTGGRFRPVPAHVPALPSCREFKGLHLVGGNIETLDADTLAGFAQAMRVNPHIQAHIAAGVRQFGYANPFDRWIHHFHSDPAVRAAHAPHWHLTRFYGFAFHSDEGRRNLIYIRISDNLRFMQRAVYHELFHSIVDNLTEYDCDLLLAHGELIREANAIGWQDFPIHPDCRETAWIENNEEAEAYAFECFAVGDPPPFGIEPPAEVKRLFKRIKAGRYAHHIVPPRSGAVAPERK